MIKTISVLLMLFALNAQAVERTATSTLDRNVTFTITDQPCTSFPNIPEGAPVMAARAFDAAKGETIYGCALDYGQQIEFQLISVDQKKHWQFILPSSDFKMVSPI